VLSAPLGLFYEGTVGSKFINLSQVGSASLPSKLISLFLFLSHDESRRKITVRFIFLQNVDN